VTLTLLQAHMVGSEVMIPERSQSTRSVSIEPGQIRCECYANDLGDDGQLTFSGLGLISPNLISSNPNPNPDCRL